MRTAHRSGASYDQFAPRKLAIRSAGDLCICHALRAQMHRSRRAAICRVTKTSGRRCRAPCAHPALPCEASATASHHRICCAVGVPWPMHGSPASAQSRGMALPPTVARAGGRRCQVTCPQISVISACWCLPAVYHSTS